MEKATVLPNNYLLHIHEDTITVYQPVDKQPYSFIFPLGGSSATKYKYYLSREVINNEVRWLFADEIALEKDIQNYISSLVRNIAFL